MSDSNGSSSPRSWFGATERVEGEGFRVWPAWPSGRVAARELVFLLGLGMAIAVIHATIRLPLRLPGHHGLETMFLMTLGCLVSNTRGSATLVATSAAGTAMVLGAGHEVLQPLLYVLPGLLLDGWRQLAPRLSSSRLAIVLLPLVAALGWSLRPLVRWLLALGTGLEFGSLRAGALYPVSTHFAFGALGGLMAVLLFRKRAGSHLG